MMTDNKMMNDKSTKKEKQIARIREMETKANLLAAGAAEFQAALDKFAEVEPAYRELSQYYGGSEWWEDKTFSEAKDFPEDLSCGVLSEDGLYNILGDLHSLAIQMLELSCDILKN